MGSCNDDSLLTTGFEHISRVEVLLYRALNYTGEWSLKEIRFQNLIMFKFILLIQRCKELRADLQDWITAVSFQSVSDQNFLPRVLKEKVVKPSVSIRAWHWSHGKTNRHISGNGKESQT